jgi:hypothetical protein
MGATWKKEERKNVTYMLIDQDDADVFAITDIIKGTFNHRQRSVFDFSCCRLCYTYIYINLVNPLQISILHISHVDNCKLCKSVNIKGIALLPGLTTRKFDDSVVRCPMPANKKPVTVSLVMFATKFR